MKKKIRLGILLFIVTITATLTIDSCNYRHALNNVNIVRYISGNGSGYSTVCLTAIVPAENYSENGTINTIRRYVIQRNRKIPDILRIMLYDSREKLSYGDCYLEITVRKE